MSRLPVITVESLCILGCKQANPLMTVFEIAEKLDMTPQNVKKHLAELSRAKLIDTPAGSPIFDRGRRLK
ncbi:MAG: helix-turn-helix domain-containing protein [Desulfotomaculaceae bacterium]|nr:helix-turn-helix domain-containing protein [Desulfotomaculaceae bacterium]